MDESKRRRLEEAGFSVGSVEEFLNLTEAEAALLDIRAGLASRLAEFRPDDPVQGYCSTDELIVGLLEEGESVGAIGDIVSDAAETETDG